MCTAAATHLCNFTDLTWGWFWYYKTHLWCDIYGLLSNSKQEVKITPRIHTAVNFGYLFYRRPYCMNSPPLLLFSWQVRQGKFTVNQYGKCLLRSDGTRLKISNSSSFLENRTCEGLNVTTRFFQTPLGEFGLQSTADSSPALQPRAAGPSQDLGFYDWSSISIYMADSTMRTYGSEY